MDKDRDDHSSKMWSGILEECKRLDSKLDRLIELSEQMLNAQREISSLLSKDNFRGDVVVPDAMALFSMPFSLRKTMLALYKLEEATAEDLSNETERLRAVESACANQLVRMGYLKKRRVGRKVYFVIDR